MAQPSNDEIRMELLRLRDVTRRTGMLHEAQVLQLKHWPYAVAPWVESSIVRVDVKGKVVRYEWTSNRRASKGAVNRGLKLLRAWVATLLGEDWKVDATVEASHGGRKAQPDPD